MAVCSGSTPDFDEASAVHAAGLRYSNLPLAGASDLTRENVLAFDTLLAGAERPLLVHCASGNRVGAMAALLAAGWKATPRKRRSPSAGNGAWPGWRTKSAAVSRRTTADAPGPGSPCRWAAGASPFQQFA